MNLNDENNATFVKHLFGIRNPYKNFERWYGIRDTKLLMVIAYRIGGKTGRQEFPPKFFAYDRILNYERMKPLSTEEFLNELPPEVQKDFLFHLDIFLDPTNEGA